NGSSNLPLKGQKGDTWEGGIHVPFFAQWKGHLPAGKVYEQPVISLDILPTAIAAAGSQPGTDWQLDGVNLLPYLDGKNTAAPHDYLCWRFGRDQRPRCRSATKSRRPEGSLRQVERSEPGAAVGAKSESGGSQGEGQ